MEVASSSLPLLYFGMLCGWILSLLNKHLRFSVSAFAFSRLSFTLILWPSIELNESWNSHFWIDKFVKCYLLIPCVPCPLRTWVIMVLHSFFYFDDFRKICSPWYHLIFSLANISWSKQWYCQQNISRLWTDQMFSHI